MIMTHILTKWGVFFILTFCFLLKCRGKKIPQHVLILVRIGLFFFLLAHMVLQFGFVTKTVSSTLMFQLLLSSAYTASRPSLFPMQPHQQVD